MPELPELTVIREVLERRVVGARIARAELALPHGALVVRDLTGGTGVNGLIDARLTAIQRRGKYLIFHLDAAPDRPRYLIVNPKLTGRLHLCAPATRRPARTCLVLGLDQGDDLRYVDDKRMGQVYLSAQPPERAGLPDFGALGPEPFDLDAAGFAAALKPFQGEIKGVLTRGEAVAGIGNAYVDEILWAAGLNPFRKRSSLSAAEIRRLFEAMQQTLAAATENVRQEMGENIHLKPRDFLSVHLRGGQPCPRCGAPIAELTANQRVTSFCRTCQPGGLVKGMPTGTPAAPRP
ncbi:MAG: hypothetical protein K1X39_14190 [Thermoflexales bacterium]|nr:hypothetical protein [Thermoflexales bacterium]